MATDSYSAIYKLFRDRALAYNAGALNTLMGGDNIYQDVPPAAPPAIYVVMRITNDVSGGDYAERIEADCEMMVFSKPRSSVFKNRLVADALDGAFKRYADGSAVNGLLHVRYRDRASVPVGTGDADPEIVQTRLVFHFFAWPMYLTQSPA
jgi:hypothetical protein